MSTLSQGASSESPSETDGGRLKAFHDRANLFITPREFVQACLSSISIAQLSARVTLEPLAADRWSLGFFNVS